MKAKRGLSLPFAYLLTWLSQFTIAYVFLKKLNPTSWLRPILAMLYRSRNSLRFSEIESANIFFNQINENTFAPYLIPFTAEKQPFRFSAYFNHGFGTGSLLSTIL